MGYELTRASRFGTTPMVIGSVDVHSGLSEMEKVYQRGDTASTEMMFR